MTVRIDSQLKLQFIEEFNELGTNLNTAINIFANTVVRTLSIPFHITAYPITEPEAQQLIGLTHIYKYANMKLRQNEHTKKTDL